MTRKEIRCEKCGKIYTAKASLSNHLRYECGKSPQFFCKLCSYKSHRKGNLERHVFTRHNIDKTLIYNDFY